MGNANTVASVDASLDESKAFAYESLFSLSSLHILILNANFYRIRDEQHPSEEKWLKHEMAEKLTDRDEDEAEARVEAVNGRPRELSPVEVQVESAGRVELGVSQPRRLRHVLVQRAHEHDGHRRVKYVIRTNEERV